MNAIESNPKLLGFQFEWGITVQKISKAILYTAAVAGFNPTKDN